MKLRKVWGYIQSDLYRYGRQKSLRKALRFYIKNKSFRYTFWLRVGRCDNKYLRFIARNIHKYLSNKYGVEIPTEVDVGYGLYIGHCISIVINPSAKIGNNCNISQSTTIGANEGAAANIGDNVYIGPNVCIVENVVIGINATIGAGAIVVKDVDKNATVAGVPAKILSYEEPGRFISNRWKE
jgi:serine O-acetyltransferase